MRILLPSIAAILLVACGTTHQYREAEKDLRDQAGSLTCWAPTSRVESTSDWTQRCSTLELQESAIDACVETLVSANPQGPDTPTVAVSDIQACMQANGWTLVRFPVFAPKTRKAMTCEGNYSWERCPQPVN
jgi:hypothetical protein